MICNYCDNPKGIIENGECESCRKWRLATLVVDHIAAATPEQLNQGTIELRRSGDKFAILARLISGEISFDEADRHMDKLRQ